MWWSSTTRRPTGSLTLLRPAIHAKGTDYTPESVPERDGGPGGRRPGGDRRRRQGAFDPRRDRGDPRAIRPGPGGRPVTPGRDATPRIALVKLSSLGDVVHALPVARALRVWWPRAELTWVVERREQAILEANPDLDHVVPVDTRLWRQEFRRPAGAASVAVEAAGPRPSPRARPLRCGRRPPGTLEERCHHGLTRAPIRVGLSAARCRERANAWFTNRHVAPPRRAVHVVDQYLAVVAGSRGGPVGRRPAGDFRSPATPWPRRRWRAGSRTRASSPGRR